MDLIYFLGRFHVLVLHLPIALVLVTVLAEWLARKEKYRYLEPALDYLWNATVVTAVMTVVLGYMHFAEGGFTGPSASSHRFFGTSVAVVVLIAWVVRHASAAWYIKVRGAVEVLLLALMFLTGHYGGNLTHGDTYLVEYAPASLRRLAGLELARAPITNLAMADPYLDIVHPIFSQRCFSCHNDDKQRGGLNLANLETTLKGGEAGAVLVAGQPEKSDLYRRISLPHDNEDFMPAEGKTPLTDDQVAVIQWWIEAGLPTETTVAQVTVPESVRPLLIAQLGVGAVGTPEASAAVSSGALSVAQADSSLVSTLQAAGFIARQTSQSEVSLIVSPIAPGTRVESAQVASLAAGSDQIIELSLPRGGLDDATLESVSRLTSLLRLRLENNLITDAGVAQLSSLSKLEYLNLYGNTGITNQSIDTLAALPALKEIYLWKTGITAQGAARLRQRRPELKIDLGDAAAASQAKGTANDRGLRTG